MAEQKKKTQDDMSEMGWTNGLYVSNAIGASFSKRHKYPSSPLQLYETPEDNEAQEFSDAERFKAFAMVFNERFKQSHSDSEPVSPETDT